jgi:hypothetical protein
VETPFFIAAVIFGWIYIIAIVYAESLLRRASSDKNLGIEVPRLLSMWPFKNLEALVFLFSVDPHRFGDVSATTFIYIARISALLVLGLGATGFYLSFPR